MASDIKSKMFLTCEVEVTIVYNHPSAWDSSSSSDQVFEQGGREAVNAVEGMFIEHAKKHGRRFTVKGNPKVRTIMGIRKDD